MAQGGLSGFSGGLKFSILGFSGVGKFGKNFFVWADLSDDFLRIFKTT